MSAGTASGRFVSSSTTGEVVRSFVPDPLPPVPAVDLAPLFPLLDRANQALGRLDGLTEVLPEATLFLYSYVRKEAVLSSQIEGTQSSLSDLLLFESDAAPGVPMGDVREVSNYVAAMQHGLDRLQEEFPLSLRLIREVHDRLLTGGRGNHQPPGEFRRSQNWIGGTRPANAVYVPPPPEHLGACLGDFERALHDESLPLLIQAGLLHVQFESIHPFLDGNGRLGRLLITLFLCQRKVLKEPLLYLSLYFKTHRSEYYDLLQRVRFEGAWTEWLTFFLEAVDNTARLASDTATALLQLFASDRARIQQLGKGSSSAFRVHEHLQRKPITSIHEAAEATGLSVPAITTAVGRLVQQEMVTEISGRRRDRLFAYAKYLEMMNLGTEPLPR